MTGPMGPATVNVFINVKIAVKSTVKKPSISMELEVKDD